MTVSELIEELRALPGDPDLCPVIVRMTIQRPYAADTRAEGALQRISLSHGELNVYAYGYVE